MERVKVQDYEAAISQAAHTSLGLPVDAERYGLFFAIVYKICEGLEADLGAIATFPDVSAKTVLAVRFKDVGARDAFSFNLGLNVGLLLRERGIDLADISRAHHFDTIDDKPCMVWPDIEIENNAAGNA